MRTIFIFIPWFYPAYKAGGPIQSITNLILALNDEYNIFVVTSAYDLQSKAIMHGIKPNNWVDMLLPQNSKTISVWYLERSMPAYTVFKRLIKEKNPDFIYLNGIFSFRFFLLPLLVIKRLHNKQTLIICPRGMLQEGALSGKSVKKKSYLKILRFSGIVNNIIWHATNTEEKEDILKYFISNEVIIAENIPKRVVQHITCEEKNPGNLSLVYLSLITEKKNLLFLLTLIKATSNISLDIYGHVKDRLYWNDCNRLINEMHHKVRYHGDILPLKVQDIFTQYHASILLTKGENFGHALYESMSAGRPIITSNFTPWKNLEQNNAGWNLDISDTTACINQLNKIKEFNQSEFLNFYTGAFQMAQDYFEKSNNQNNYKKLFSNLSEGK